MKTKKTGQPAHQEAATLPRRTRSQSSEVKAELDKPAKRGQSTLGIKKEPTDDVAVGNDRANAIKVKKEPVQPSKRQVKKEGDALGQANIPQLTLLKLPGLEPAASLITGGAGREVGNKRKAEKPVNTQGKQKSAKTQKPASSETRFFTCYWSPLEIDSFAGVDGLGPQGIHVTGGNAKRISHNKLKPGDVYFPVTLKKGRLMVLGRLRVEDTVEPDNLSRQALEQWHFSRNLPIIAGCYSPQVLIETEPELWAGVSGKEFEPLTALRWLKPDGQERALTDPSNMRYVTTALQGVYRLSPKSADLLSKCLQ